ncbi:ATP12 family chaperone protein [Phreatobacter stygius]|nr:ATP12 family protein [Phreatobacter stygius]
MTRSVFDDWFAKGMDPAAYDPTAAARLSMKTQLPKRFYAEAGVGEADGAFRLLLDGRSAKTPSRHPLAVPTRRLAEAVAAEWAAQRQVIDPATMPLTRIVNAIIEGVVPDPAPVADDIVRYSASDLLCYRAATPASLVARHAAAWDPVLAWARDALGARFILSEGIVHVTQPERALAALRAALPDDAWRLGAMHVVTTLTGSALLAVALQMGRLTPAEVWSAAHVDEDFQTELWGHDEDAAERRRAREREMMAAATVLASL